MAQEDKIQSLCLEIFDLHTHNDDLSTEISKLRETALEREHLKLLKHIKQLEHDTRTCKDAQSKNIYSLNCLLSESKSAFTSLQSENSTLFYSLANANNQLSAKSTLVHNLQKQIYALQKQVEHSKSSLSSTCSLLKKLSVWNPMKGGTYIPEAWKLFHILKQSGVCNCDLAVKAVTEALGVKVKCIMSRRTGSHCMKEGGLGKKIVDTYSNSPLAQHDGKKMDGDDYFWKQTLQNMDYASNGKKNFKLIDEKKDIVKAAKKTADELTTQERGAIAMDLLEQCIGKEMHETWKWLEELKGPCDLANKSHKLATKIPPTTMTLKLLTIDSETGYQEKYHMFMKARKEDLYELLKTESGKIFPDVSNTWYQSHSYAAAELLIFCDDYQELVEEICDRKTKQGANHLEGNVLKGLHDPDTLAELGAMAIEVIP
ncbi:hypothetical protein BT96DRAFT_939727 [Gymnopus androsaceus JB14]|uniref:Uncharacterized protein n=1 Tax=Gymnopus androsaceus JB14 TaxID=1447944 RepID=A0A6A4HLW6_9AGAR|nr:hypothetical protein BT96DRAFT_939727 [Gymnopus androsaceus JB14]